MSQLELFDQPIPEVVSRLTFNQAMRLFIEIYWAKKKMHQKTASFERYLLRYFDGRFIDTIGRQDVENMRRWLAGPGICERRERLGISAINKCHTILSLLYSKLEQWKEDGWAGSYNFTGLTLPRRNPGRLVHKAKEPVGDRAFTPWEFRTLFKICRRVGDTRLADMFRVGIFARLRPEDLLALNDDEISEERFQIELYRRHTKNDRNPQGCLQVIPLTEKIWGVIERNRRFRKPGDKTVFSGVNLRRRVMKIRKIAVAEGMKDFTLLALRRSGSTYLHEKGVDIETNADGMGHTSSRMLRAGYYIPRHKPRLKRLSKMLSEAF